MNLDYTIHLFLTSVSERSEAVFLPMTLFL